MNRLTYGMDHIGITAPDFEQGIAFFKAVFGAVDLFRTGRFEGFGWIYFRAPWARTSPRASGTGHGREPPVAANGQACR